MWAGELDTLLLRWDDGWLPGLRWSSKEGTGEGLSGTRSCNPSNNKKKHTQNEYPVQSHPAQPDVRMLIDFLQKISHT